MLNFEVKKLSFKFNGESYEIDYPTIKKVNEFRKKLSSEQDEVDVTVDFLVELGAKREVIESLRVSQLSSLVEELTQEIQLSKKN
jgi:hypothetical protein